LPAAWRAWFAGDGPRRQRGRAARRPGEPCGPEARGGGARARAGALRDGEQRRLARPRRRGVVPEVAAAESEGEKVSEEEEVARILTARSNRAEEGQEREFDGRGEASGGNNGGRGVLGADLAGERLNRAREGVVELQGEVNRLGVRAIEAER